MQTDVPVEPLPIPAAPAETTDTRPVRKQERVSSVDALRGVALLGILLMNVLSFGLPGPAYDDPSITGPPDRAGLWTWFTVSVFFEGTMRALFSMLFGAGLILMTSRADERGDARIADIWLRRNLWLLLFGMLHGYLLWSGDILYAYGLAGLFLYPFRKIRPRNLILLALAVLATQAPKSIGHAFDLRTKRAEAEIAALVAKTKLPVTEELKKAKEGWEETLKEAKPSKIELEKIYKTYRGSYSQILEKRAKETLGWHTKGMYLFGIWDVAGMMLTGMALLKLGVLSATAPARLYLAMVLLGYGVGVPIRVWGALKSYHANFDLVAMAESGVVYDLGRLLVAAGHLALVMLLCRAPLWLWLTRRWAAVGQMALTNYICHTLICTTFFYGYGLGKFGMLARHELYYLVGAIWVAQLIWSPIWLARFQFGPLEWLWRSLTYAQKQPFRIAPAPEVSRG